MRKGFVISISTLYYVAFFMIFLLVLVYSTNNYFIKFGSSYNKTNIDYQTNDFKDNISENKWCDIYISYDANESLESQSEIKKEKVCEGYENKRLV